MRHRCPFTLRSARQLPVPGGRWPWLTVLAITLGLSGVWPASAGAGDAEGPNEPREVLVLRARTHFWAAVGAHLKHAELQRLKAMPGIDDAIATLLEGWDGDGDTVDARMTDKGLEVVVNLVHRVCPAPVIGPESGMRPREPGPCVATPDPVGTRTLEVSQAIWSIPKKRDRSVATSPPPQPDPPEPVTKINPQATLMRIRLGGKPWQIVRAFLSDDLALRHHMWRDEVARTPWRDPLLPKSVLAAGDALAPMTPPPAKTQDNAYDNLRNPFDDSRMQTAWPVPPMVTQPGPLANSPGAFAFGVETYTDSCDAEVNGLEYLDMPPTMRCFRVATQHNRLLFNKLPGPVSALLQLLSVPGLNEVRMIATADAMASDAWRMAWVASWLHWVGKRPAQVESSLRQLSEAERRELRRFVGRWWSKRSYSDFQPLLDEIVERHFTALYPEALDIHRLPRRDFFDDAWLWAGNWLAMVARLPAGNRVQVVASSLAATTIADIGHLRSRVEAAVRGDNVPSDLRVMLETIEAD